ncbi:uncharacterized protein LOC124257070 [Haliotis rubra]|uniref:uncharacterized protein LOC124257070 n=1 Tax=Haliotis rubra TaxID=36100 RepID=UPI001EE512CA|nr:uncharacterized protein LOC124257070 [Haliotis rubra]
MARGSIVLLLCVLVHCVSMVMMSKIEIASSSFQLSRTRANMSVAELDCQTRNGTSIHLTDLRQSTFQTSFLLVAKQLGKAVWLGRNGTKLEAEGRCSVLYPNTPDVASINSSDCGELHHYICFQSTNANDKTMTTIVTGISNSSASSSGHDSITPAHVIVIIYVVCVVIVLAVGVAVVKFRKHPMTSMMVPYRSPPPSLPLIYGVQHSRIRPPFHRRLTPQVRKLSEVSEGAENSPGSMLLYNEGAARSHVGAVDDIMYEQYNFSPEIRGNDCPMTPDSETYTPLLNPPTDDGDVTSTIIFFGPNAPVPTGLTSLNTDAVLENPVYESYVGSTYV